MNRPASSSEGPLDRMLRSKFEHGPAAYLVALVRAAVGFLIASISTGKFVDHAKEAVDFDRYGVPLPDVAVYAVGVVELAGGLLLIVGLLTRPAAAALALTLIGAIATAGRIEGGSFHLGVGPALLVVMLALLWVGSGRPALDAVWLQRRRKVPPPQSTGVVRAE